MKYFFIVFMSLALVFSSCVRADNSCQNCPNEEYVWATIKWTGSIAVDGCDWTVKIDGSNIHYHPDVLETKYKQDGLHVRIKFKVTNADYSCGMNPAAMKVIHVEDIKP